MVKYNQVKLQCLLADKLFNEFDIVFNVKTVSVLLDCSTDTIKQFLHRTTPEYFTAYADSEHTFGRTLKYGVRTDKAKRVREKLSHRLIHNEHLNLRKPARKVDYSEFYIFNGIDRFPVEFNIDLRSMIEKRNLKSIPTDSNGEILPSNKVLYNNRWYPEGDKMAQKQQENTEEKKRELVEYIKLNRKIELKIEGCKDDNDLKELNEAHEQTKATIEKLMVETGYTSVEEHDT
ncbi:MAG: hypothetical protein KAJ39_09420 [Gammaproteobacteria bacterium]|nr:hypothetical protein [Gammaproteobacteria bacterium]